MRFLKQQPYGAVFWLKLMTLNSKLLCRFKIHQTFGSILILRCKYPELSAVVFFHSVMFGDTWKNRLTNGRIFT
jgi:hypothetical protein